MTFNCCCIVLTMCAVRLLPHFTPPRSCSATPRGFLQISLLLENKPLIGLWHIASDAIIIFNPKSFCIQQHKSDETISLVKWQPQFFQTRISQKIRDSSPIERLRKKSFYNCILILRCQCHLPPHCLKIVQNVAFEFLNFDIFHQVLSC